MKPSAAGTIENYCLHLNQVFICYHSGSGCTVTFALKSEEELIEHCMSHD